VLLRDTTCWPGSVLEEILCIPSMELIPTMVAIPLYATDLSIPFSVAYVPQYGAGLPPIMVFTLSVQCASTMILLVMSVQTCSNYGQRCIADVYLAAMIAVAVHANEDLACPSIIQ